MSSSVCLPYLHIACIDCVECGTIFNRISIYIKTYKLSDKRHPSNKLLLRLCMLKILVIWACGISITKYCRHELVSGIFKRDGIYC
jgi:hypothetical protein